MISTPNELVTLVELARAGSQIAELVVARGAVPAVPYVRVRAHAIGEVDWMERAWAACEVRAAHTGATLTVRQISRDAEEPAIVFDHVPGVSLAMLNARLREEAELLPASVALALAAELAHGIARVHERYGHGRIDPANVVIGVDGSIHWGPPHVDVMVSSACARSSALPYLAPELLAEDAPSREADVFALGVLIGELFSGQVLREPGRMEPRVQALLAGALTHDPTTRPLAAELAERLFDAEPINPRALDLCLAKLVARHFESFVEQRAGTLRDALERERRAKGTTTSTVQIGDGLTLELLGRGDVLRDIESRLDRGARLISVVGPAGVGKSRVAAALTSGRHAKSRDPDATAAIRWCDVSGLDSEAALDDAIEEWTRSAASRGSGSLIFVLDGFDRVVGFGAPRLERWLDDHPDVQLLLTSRSRLGLPNEQVVELPPLPTGSWDTPGVRLLRTAAGERAATFDAVERDALTALADRLEGIPLALELAGRRLLLLRPSQLLGALEARDAEGLDALGSGSRSLRDAIEFSLSLLNEEALHVLRACSVFARSFDALDALEVADRSLGPTLDALGTLRERSLIWSPGARESKRGSTGENRLRLYDAVRELVESDLDPDTRQELRARHATHFANRARQAVRAIDEGERVVDHLGSVARDREDFLAALTFLSDNDPEHASYVARVLGYGTYRGGRQRKQIAELHERLSSAPGSAVSAATRVRVALAHVGHPWDRRADAQAVLEPLATAPRADALPAASHLEMAWCLADSRTPGESNDRLEVRVRKWLAEPELAPVHRVYGFRALARIARARGDQGAALDAFRAALDTARGSSLVGLQATLASIAAGIALDVDGPAAAQSLADEALDLAESLGSVPIRFTAKCSRAAAMQEQGDADAAHREFVDAAALAERIERRPWQTAAAAHAAMASIEAGRPEAALRELDAIRLVATTPRDHIFGVVTMFAAAAAKSAGDHAKAAARLADARVDVGDLEAHRSVIDVLAPWIELDGIDLDRSGPSGVAGSAIARARDAYARAPTQLFEHRAALRLVEAALEAKSVSSRPLEIVADGRWVRTPAGDTIDFRRRKLVRTLLMALVEARTRAEPEVSVDAMIAAGWPGTRLRAEVMRNRLHVAMNRLRELGLREYLETTPEGWRLHPEVPIARAAS